METKQWFVHISLNVHGIEKFQTYLSEKIIVKNENVRFLFIINIVVPFILTT